MLQFIMGCIRQLTNRKETNAQRLARAARSDEPFVGESVTKGQVSGGGRRLRDLVDLHGREGTGRFVVQGTATGSGTRARQKQLNIRIQSAAADIVTRLIAADVIPSQQAERVEEIVGDMLRRAFGGAMLATKGWLAAGATGHTFHKEIRLRSQRCEECHTDTDTDWLA